MPSVSTPYASSGITTSATGDRHIPASVRADGSTRKEIKIRPGYKPPEDVEIYKNRTAEAWKGRGSSGVPGAAIIGTDGQNKGGNTKNAKRREARKKAKAAEEVTQSDRVAPGNTVENDELDRRTTVDDPTASRVDTKQEDAPSNAESQHLDPEAEKDKRVRNLKKRLRQARDLREKEDKGENLLPEQFEKVIKINELIRQLDSLGFDQEGEPK